MTKKGWYASLSPEKKEEIRSKRKEYRDNHPEFKKIMQEKVKEYRKERYKNDPEYRKKYNEYQREYRKKRCQQDPEFRKRECERLHFRLMKKRIDKMVEAGKPVDI